MITGKILRKDFRALINPNYYLPINKAMMKIMRRKPDDKQTLGTGEADGFTFYTLELPWLGNKFQVSSISTGTYTVVKRWSPKYKWHFHILGVTGRTWILIHAGNYYYHTKGCILVGAKLMDINHDGYDDTVTSRVTLNKLLKILPKKFTLVII